MALLLLFFLSKTRRRELGTTQYYNWVKDSNLKVGVHEHVQLNISKYVIA